MPEQKPCCPNCRSEKLSLIGGVFISTEGTPFKGTDLNQKAILDFIKMGGAFTRELLFCIDCNKQCLLAKAKEAASLPKDEYFFQGTDVGTSVPIRCPVCNNSTAFTRRVLRSVEITEELVIGLTEIKEVVSVSDPVIQDEVVLSYQCDLAECQGEIILHRGEYGLALTG